MRGLSPIAASGGHSSSRCAGLSLSWPLLLRSMGSRRAGSVIVAHGPSCSAACGIFPDQGSNPCPLHWQADSQPLRHRGSPGSDCFDLRGHAGFLPETFHLCRAQILDFPAASISQILGVQWGSFQWEASYCLYQVNSLEIHLTQTNLSKTNTIKSQCA